MNLQYLSVKLKVAAAVSKQDDLPLHFLILFHSSLLVTMIVEENGKIEIDQRVGSVGNGSPRKENIPTIIPKTIQHRLKFRHTAH